MKVNGAVYIIVGAVALLGALFAAYVNFTIGSALGAISAASTSEIPPGTDLASIQQMVPLVSAVLLVMWIWIIAVIASSALTIQMGWKTLKSRGK